MSSSTHRHNVHTPAGDNRAALRDLQWAIRVHQRVKRELVSHDADPGGRPAVTSLELATCDCSRELRVAPGMLSDGGIVCGICFAPFRPAGR
jgi:hypothetical protein